MPVEIERKFTVTDHAWREDADKGIQIRQGYIINENNCSVRVRIYGDGRANLTTKLPRAGISRYEFEQPISLREAESLMELCGEAVVEKTRYEIEFGGLVWEVDAYERTNLGLVIAEIELDRENQSFQRPAWIGHEVTGIPRYQNSRLAARPFRTWSRTRDARLPVAAESALI